MHSNPYGMKCYLLAIVALIAIVAVVPPLASAAPGWDVAAGYERFHQLCMDEPRIRLTGYCRCAAKCYDQNFAVRDKIEAIQFLQCMSECACDARMTLCLVLEKHRPAMAKSVCPRFQSVCTNTKRHELVHYADPRGGNVRNAHEDSRLSEIAVDQLVEVGFCAFCLKGHWANVACIPCLLTQPST